MCVTSAVPEALKTSNASDDSKTSSCWLPLLATASAERVPPAARLAPNVPIVSTNHSATTGQRWRADQTRRARSTAVPWVAPLLARSGLHALHGHGDRAATAETQRREPIATFAPLELVEERRDDARAA